MTRRQPQDPRNPRTHKQGDKENAAAKQHIHVGKPALVAAALLGRSGSGTLPATESWRMSRVRSEVTFVRMPLKAERDGGMEPSTTATASRKWPQRQEQHSNSR